MRLFAFSAKRAPLYLAVWEHEGVYVRKHIQITPTSFEHDVRSELLRRLVRSAREAARDVAFQKYGKDWKEHVVWGGFFDAPTEAELRMVESALIDV